MRIHPDGWPYIVIAVALNALVFALAGWFGLLLVPVTAWCVAFFRDPDRTAPTGDGLIVSPADGVMLPLVEAAPPPLPVPPAHARVRWNVVQFLGSSPNNAKKIGGKLGPLHPFDRRLCWVLGETILQRALF